MFGLRSIRRRIIALSVLLTGVLLGAAFFTETRVGAATAGYQHDLALQQHFTSGIGQLKNTVYNMESGVYRYAALQDDSARSQLDDLLSEITRQLATLRTMPFVAGNEELRSDVNRLTTVLTKVDAGVRQLVRVIGNVNERFPPSGIITDTLYPLNQAFTTALDDAVADVEDSAAGSRGMGQLHLLYKIRYLWAQQISSVRIYVANRSGVFGVSETSLRQHLKNRGYYVDAIRGDLRALHKDERGVQNSLVLRDSVAAMEQALERYEKQFSNLVDSYDADGWRGDLTMLRNTIQPQFATVRLVLNDIDDKLNSMSAAGLMDSLRLAETLNAFLWRITAAAVVLMLLAYLAYEVTIRRPLDQVINALEALGRGEAFTPLLKTNTYETDTLLRAFREMQRQVQGRELRLASILDNASDGIITINESGLVETFNNAAETLFQYREEEVLGKSVNMLMPHLARDEHDNYIARYLETGLQHIIGSEVNVNAQRKDGAVFPMSIKVSELVLDGKRYFTAIVADVSERKAMLDNLRHLAEHDSLTGLYNRQYFTEELERTVQRSLRQGGIDCALLYIDLDNFKFVNDTMGHLAGDQVLIDVANLLTRRTRKSDLVARLGGDEFAVLLYDVNEEQTTAVAEEYRQLLSEYQYRHDGKVIDVGCSIGVALFEESIKGREDLMARADVSCHLAKRAGRNSVHTFEANDRARMDSMFADMGWARTIKQAIEENRFIFAMQPIVTLPECAVEKFELLLRMRSEHGEIIMPSGFLPSAERFGLIIDVDRWVVQHAIELLGGDRLAPSVHVTVNLSAMAIGDQEVLRLITEGLEQHRVDPRRLTFEITETIAVADLAAASEFLNSLRALGCATALDDFGVGYCSFAYLKDLPVDYVKIDGSFVRDIARDPVQLAMVKSMNEIAHAMGKLSVAEFVDNETVLAMLSDIGVDFAQGYLVGKPQLVDTVGSAVTEPVES